MKEFREAVKRLVEYDFCARDELKSMGPFKASHYPNGWSMPIMITFFVALFYAGMLTVFYFLSGKFAPRPMSVAVLGAFLVFYFLMYFVKHLKNANEARNERARRDRILADRKKFVEACTVAARSCGVDLYPWWERFNPYQNFMKNYTPHRIWCQIPRKPLTRVDGKIYFDKIRCGAVEITGQELIEKYVRALDGKGKPIYKCFLDEKISRDEKYFFASFGNYYADSAAYTQRVWYADKDADAKTREYERQLDLDECVANAFWDSEFSTDKEMYIKGYGTTYEYIQKRDKRNKRVADYRNGLGEYEVYIEDEGLYYMHIDFMGYTVFDESFSRIIGVLVPREDMAIRIKTNSKEPGEGCEAVEIAKDAVRSMRIYASDALQHVTFYSNGEFDFAVNKPDCVTDDEWGLWIYSHYTEEFLFIDETCDWRYWDKR